MSNSNQPVAKPPFHVAPVISAFASKINWTQAAPIIVTALGYAGVRDITPEQLLAIFSGVSAASQVATVIFRTFFTTSVITSSLPAK